MAYWKTLCWRALNESWDLVVGQPLGSVFVAVAVFFLAFKIKRSVSGAEAMKGAVADALIGVTAVMLLMCVVFLIHVLLVTPARMFREKESDRAQLAEQVLKDAARFINRDAKIAFVPVDGPKKDGFFIVRITFANIGNSGAIDTESDLLMIDPSLQRDPLFHKKGSSSNEIQGTTLLGVNSDPLTLTKNDPPYFVVAVIRFTDANTKATRQSAFYFKFGGTDPSGNFVDALWGVSVADKKRLISYLKDRGLVYIED